MAMDEIWAKEQKKLEQVFLESKPSLLHVPLPFPVKGGQALLEMLAAHASAETAPVTERVEAYFEVRAVGPTSLAIETITGEAKMTVPVPGPVAAACRPG